MENIFEALRKNLITFSGLLALYDLIVLMSASTLWTTLKGQDEVNEEVAL